ncbi:alpha-glucosidase C-terminal domain-containing protein, partial [Balneolaceae bacterium ANBcel3]|nr:alpha-glucosidase C-terminal domain-containing protein [Balneolaceae bacterium ANBcel3]
DALYEYYQKLAHLKSQHPCLKKGNFEVKVVNDKQNTLAYRRTHEKTEVWVVVNNSSKIRTIRIPTKKEELEDLLSGELFKGDGKGVDAEVGAFSGRLLE